MSMRRILPLALLLTAGPLLAQPQTGLSPALAGRVEGKVYVSPGGVYRIAIPVLPELGGAISDTPTVVTFQDHFNVHVSIAAFPMDATQRWELSTRGVKDYLSYFFETFVMGDFRNIFPDARTESTKFLPDTANGALLAYTLLPGGSMFADQHAILGADEKPPVAKRGNLVFVRSGTIYIISTELAERVIERSTYKKTTAEEDELLRVRLADMLKKIEFTRPATNS
jgi:hypothetical protein